MNKLNNKFRAIIAIAIMLTFGIQSFAEKIEIDGIYYSTTESSKTASVISGTNKYTGEVIIPGSITYNDAEYTVTSISSSAFKSCSGMSKLSIPNSISTISDGTFDECTSLTNLIICEGESALHLGRSNERNWGGNHYNYSALFTNCQLINVYIGRNISYNFVEDNYQSPIDSYYGPFYKQNIKNLEFSDNVTEIHKYAFAGNNMTEISIPNSVISIGERAFLNCDSLSSVSIGNSVETIESSAFGGCNNLLDVKSYNPMPHNINAGAFSTTTYTNAILTVPYKCNGLYAGRTGWGSFNTIIEMEKPSIYLTIKLPESGIITHKEVYDEVAELSFKANDGWQINTVSFNEDDVTSQLDDDGNYTTPVLTEDATLIVVFEKIPTGVEPLTLTNDIKVYVKDGFVEIVGANAESVVNIYDTMGISKYIGKDNSIYLEDSGIYILTVEGRTFKFAM